MPARMSLLQRSTFATLDIEFERQLDEQCGSHIQIVSRGVRTLRTGSQMIFPDWEEGVLVLSRLASGAFIVARTARWLFHVQPR